VTSGRVWSWRAECKLWIASRRHCHESTHNARKLNVNEVAVTKLHPAIKITAVRGALGYSCSRVITTPTALLHRLFFSHFTFAFQPSTSLRLVTRRGMKCESLSHFTFAFQPFHFRTFAFQPHPLLTAHTHTRHCT
jgi:hypothetical protein